MKVKVGEYNYSTTKKKTDTSRRSRFCLYKDIIIFILQYFYEQSYHFGFQQMIR